MNEDLQPAGAAVGDADVAVRVGGERNGAALELAVLLALGAELAQVVALAVEDLHAVVETVGDGHLARLSESVAMPIVTVPELFTRATGRRHLAPRAQEQCTISRPYPPARPRGNRETQLQEAAAPQQGSQLECDADFY